MSTTTTAREYLPALVNPHLLPFYDRFSRFLGARDAHWRLLVQAGIEPGTRVLEIGCGTGNLVLLAADAEPGAVITGIDPDPEAIAWARRKAARAGSAVTLQEGFAEEIPMADGSVDRVLSSFMLHHVSAPGRVLALREARRVLAPGGRLHLVDIDRGEPMPLARAVSRLASTRLRAAAHGHLGRHDHGALDGRGAHGGQGAQGHGHGYGHGHGHGHEGPDVAAMLAEAGFSSVVNLGTGESKLGGFTFWRAEG